jgi:cytochrome b561
MAGAARHGTSLFDLFSVPKFGTGDAATRRSINGWHQFAANLMVVVGFLHAAAAWRTNMCGGISFSPV